MRQVRGSEFQGRISGIWNCGSFANGRTDPTRFPLRCHCCGRDNRAAATLLPLIDQMNPSADVLALLSIEVDLTPIQPGQSVTFTLAQSSAICPSENVSRNWPKLALYPIQDLIDPSRAMQFSRQRSGDRHNRLTPNVAAAPPASHNRERQRQQPKHPNGWLSLACVRILVVRPRPARPRSSGQLRRMALPLPRLAYDTAGRVRVGPAPQNLAVPPYAFLSNTRIKVGDKPSWKGRLTHRKSGFTRWLDARLPIIRFTHAHVLTYPNTSAI